MKVTETGDGDENAMNLKKTMHMQKSVQVEAKWRQKEKS